MNYFSDDSKYIANTYKRFGVVLTHGKGSKVYDADGKEYIDMASGIAVNTFGIADEKWISAVNEQVGKIQHASNLYYTEPQIKLSKMLCEKAGMKKVFFSNSGAEANECAIKTARKYADMKNPDKKVILTLINSFHGRTVTTLTATGQDKMHVSFGPFTEGFRYIPANDIEAFRAEIAKGDVCAVMFELVQGEGGVLPLEKAYVDELVSVARENDILVIVDEVQTGNGRTGEMYCYKNFGFTPDIVSTAKGLGGGLPIGATMFSEKTENVLTAGDHGSTYGGNPICAAGAVSIVERLDAELFAEVKKKGEYIKEKLITFDGVKSVSGMGLMMGIETEKPAPDCIKACMDNGLLVISAKEKVRLLPALNISWEDIDKALEIMKDAFKN